MSILKNKLFLIVVILVFAAAAFYWLNPAPAEEPSGTASPEEVGKDNGIEENSGLGEATYPNNLLEGMIVDINREGLATFVMEADVSKIEGLAGKEKMMKTIKITNKTEIIVYDLSAREEKPLNFGDLEVGDSVVVATQESTQDDLLGREEFTATKVSKMVNPAQPNP